MPLRMNIGLSRKVGESNYGSRGASVNVELELDSSLVSEPEKLKDRIRHLFGLVRNSLDEELNGTNGHASPGQPAKQEPKPEAARNGGENGSSRATGQRGSNGRQATQSQVKAIFAIAKSQRLDLKAYLTQHFGVAHPDKLDIKAASQVIDDLKQEEGRRS
jgi:hypothetical protein